jgi:hypothetical protein
VRIRLRVGLTGTRNGVEWPPRGSEMDLPEQEARDMIHGGLVDPVTMFRDAETAVPTPAETREALVPKRTLKA